MAALSIGKPIRTRRPRVEVDAGLKPGRHRFRLVVTLADGRRSAPAELVMTIGKPRPPFDPDVPVDPGRVRRRPRRRRPDPEE